MFYNISAWCHSMQNWFSFNEICIILEKCNFIFTNSIASVGGKYWAGNI